MKKVTNKLGEKQFLKSFFSYFFIFLIPFLLLTTVLYYSAIIGLKQQLYAANQNSLKQATNLLNERFTELENLADTIEINPKLSSFMLKHPYYSIESNRELSQIQSNSSFIDEMYVYYNQDKTFYSRNGTYNINALRQNKYNQVAFQTGELEKNLETEVPRPSITAYRNQGSRKLFQYYVPLKTNGITYGSIVYVINNEELQQVVDTAPEEFQGFTYLLDNHYNTVLASQELAEDGPFAQAFSKENLASKTVKFDKKKYSVSSFTSEMSGLTLASIVEVDQFLQPIVKTRNLFYLMIVFVFLVGIITSYLLGLRQYIPMKKVDDAFKQILSKEYLPVEDSKGSFFDGKIDRFLEEHLEMNQMIKEQQNYLQSYFIERLISGGYKDRETLNREMEQLSLKLTGEKFFVTILSSEISKNKEANTKIKTVLLNAFPLKIKGVQFHSIEIPAKKQLVILGYADKRSTSLYLALKSLKEEVSKVAETRLLFSVGNSYDDLLFVNRSYIDALTVAEQHRQDQRKDIMFFSEIRDTQPKLLSMATEIKSKLKSSLLEGDEVVVGETLDQLLFDPKTERMSVYERRFYCYDVLRTVLGCVSQCNQQELVKNFEQLMSFDSFDYFYAELNILIHDFCLVVGNLKEQQTSDLGSGIMEYINLNFASPELSLESIAVEFDFSVSYLSRIIKEQAGVTFSNYVQELRLEKIKQELVSTSKVIKDIVNDAGYYDVSNYTRKFKQITGLTPGQYRKETRKSTTKAVS